MAVEGQHEYVERMATISLRPHPFLQKPFIQIVLYEEPAPPSDVSVDAVRLSLRRSVAFYLLCLRIMLTSDSLAP